MNDSKILGDSGEHYALSMFGFYGYACSKLPDNWKYYDLIVQKHEVLERVSVKTRSETSSFGKGSWFKFEIGGHYDWMAFIIKFRSGEIRSWVIPIDEAAKVASVPGANEEVHNIRRLSWGKIESSELNRFRDNWALSREGVR
jgi:hypothetical protein